MTLDLTIACGEYDRTIALQSGAVVPKGINLNFLAMNLPSELFRRQARTAQFDVSEFSLSTHSLLRAQGDQRFVGLPVFLSRKFRHSEVFINAGAGIREAKDLAGKRVGVMEYQQTANVWIRGFLQHDYGVGADQMEWYFGGYNEPDPNYTERVPLSLPSRIRTVTIPPDKSLNQMLDRGEIDAIIAPNSPMAFRQGSPNTVRLFPDYQERDVAYYQRTGIFPIMHLVVMKREIYEAAPWAAVSLYNSFVEAKKLGIERLRHEGSLFCTLPWIMSHLEEAERLLGADPFRYGFEECRDELETFVQYSCEQGLMSEPVPVEELFAAETHLSVELAHA